MRACATPQCSPLDRTLIERWHPGCMGSVYSPVNLDESPVRAFSAPASCGRASTPACNPRRRRTGQGRSPRRALARRTQGAGRLTSAKGGDHAPSAHLRILQCGVRRVSEKQGPALFPCRTETQKRTCARRASTPERGAAGATGAKPRAASAEAAATAATSAAFMFL